MSVDSVYLGEDLLAAQESMDYNKKFYVKLIRRGVVNPMRAYFYYQATWWGARVNFKSYPIGSTSELPEVKFDRVPPCPDHARSWHPNIYDTGAVCWGSISLLPDTRVIGVLQAVACLLVAANHSSAVRECDA